MNNIFYLQGIVYKYLLTLFVFKFKLNETTLSIGLGNLDVF